MMKLLVCVCDDLGEKKGQKPLSTSYCCVELFFFTMLYISKPISLPVGTGFFPGPSRTRALYINLDMMFSDN